MTENKHGFAPKQEIKIGGIAFTIIQTAESWVKCIASECIGERAFDAQNRNDFAASDIREFLNGEFLKRLIAEGAPEEMFEHFNVDLTADDGLRDYGGRLFNLALPRVRDFRGIPDTSFDGRGNYAMGLKEQLIFPEINYDDVDKIRGMDIVFVTTAKTDEEAKELLSLMGMPFIQA